MVQTHQTSNLTASLLRLQGQFSSFTRAWGGGGLASFQGKQGVEGAYANSSGWFKHIKPPLTFSNFEITELVRCVHEFGVVQPY